MININNIMLIIAVSSREPTRCLSVCCVWLSPVCVYLVYIEVIYAVFVASMACVCWFLSHCFFRTRSLSLSISLCVSVCLCGCSPRGVLSLHVFFCVFSLWYLSITLLKVIFCLRVRLSLYIFLYIPLCSHIFTWVSRLFHHSYIDARTHTHSCVHVLDEAPVISVCLFICLYLFLL
jgi:hypothetical protein